MLLIGRTLDDRPRGCPQDSAPRSNGTTPRAFALGVALAGALFAFAPPTQAQWSEPLRPGDAEKATRRADLTVGMSGGLHVGTAQGFPNEADKLGDPAFEEATGFAVGPNFSLWFGGALTDYLNFALGLAMGGLAGNGRSAEYSAVLVRIETFPLLGFGDALSDVGVNGAFGIGGSAIRHDGEEKATGGALSVVNFGVFHETVRFGSLRFGPNVDFTHLFSQSFSSASFTAGLRAAIYTGP